MNRSRSNTVGQATESTESPIAIHWHDQNLEIQSYITITTEYDSKSLIWVEDIFVVL